MNFIAALYHSDSLAQAGLGPAQAHYAGQALHSDKLKPGKAQPSPTHH